MRKKTQILEWRTSKKIEAKTSTIDIFLAKNVEINGEMDGGLQGALLCGTMFVGMEQGLYHTFP
jgi:hypothetical protein